MTTNDQLPRIVKQGTFIASCVDNNTEQEIEAALEAGPHESELKIWNLTPDQWRAEVELALIAKRNGE